VEREDGDSLPPEDATTGYSGQIRLRLPRSLHERLARLPTAEGVSLVRYRCGAGRVGLSDGQHLDPESRYFAKMDLVARTDKDTKVEV